MPPAQPETPARSRRGVAAALAFAALALVAAGLAGLLSAAWGYALFAAATALFAAAAGSFGVLAFTRAGPTLALRRGLVAALGAGIAAYALALAAFAGFFAHETLQGRMEWRWIVFGPVALAALVVLDKGLYRKLVANNLPTWRRFGQYVTREQADPAAMRRVLVDEVVLHRSLYAASRLRWWRHTLIFWGFGAMVLVELLAVFAREALPAFGLRDVWREPGHPLRLAFDAAFDATGLAVLAGCLLALAWRVGVRGRPERKFADTPTTVFLLAVVASGFVVEGLRIALAPGAAGHGASFVGLATAAMLGAAGLVRAALYEPLWIAHAVGACAFIAYVPVKRLVHTCATPVGRLMNSQKELLARRKRGVLAGLQRERAAASAPAVAPGAGGTARG